MSIASAFYDGVYGLGRGLAQAFNFAACNTALEARGLERNSGQEFIAGFGGMMLGAGVGMVAAIAMFSMFSPLVALPLFLAITAESALLPAQLTAAYRIGEHEAEQRPQQKPTMG